MLTFPCGKLAGRLWGPGRHLCTDSFTFLNVYLIFYTWKNYEKIVFIGFLGLVSASLAVSAHEGHRHNQAKESHSAVAIADAPLSKDVVVSACWIRSLPLPAPSAGYFLVKNNGDKAVNLVGAASTSYDMVMLHQTTNVDGLSKMSMTHAIDIPAGNELEFKPGGYHAMLENRMPMCLWAVQ